MSKPSNPPKNGVQIYVPPKLVIVAFAILLGSGAGGFGISNLFNGSGADARGKEPSGRRHRDREFNVRFKRIETTQTKHTEKIEELDEQVDEIQSVQHKDIARTEARRVTQSIINKRRRREMEDRIYEINLTRLRDKKSPCLDRTCAN